MFVRVTVMILENPGAFVGVVVIPFEHVHVDSVGLVSFIFLKLNLTKVISNKISNQYKIIKRSVDMWPV